MALISSPRCSAIVPSARAPRKATPSQIKIRMNFVIAFCFSGYPPFPARALSDPQICRHGQSQSSDLRVHENGFSAPPQLCGWLGWVERQKSPILVYSRLRAYPATLDWAATDATSIIPAASALEIRESEDQSRVIDAGIRRMRVSLRC